MLQRGVYFTDNTTSPRNGVFSQKHRELNYPRTHTLTLTRAHTQRTTKSHYLFVRAETQTDTMSGRMPRATAFFFFFFLALSDSDVKVENYPIRVLNPGFIDPQR